MLIEPQGFGYSLSTLPLCCCRCPSETLSSPEILELTHFFLITFGILTKVDLPSPDSPTTIRVNSNPRRSDLRYTWLGRLEKPKIKNDIIVSFQVCL